MERDGDSRIARLEKLYEAGDYKEARFLAKALVADDKTPAEHRERAARIIKATGKDPVAVGAMVFSLAVLLFLVVKYAL